MARSDNVVRAGLTPKFKDVHVLGAMLSYDTQDVHIFRPNTEVHPNRAGLQVNQY